jgi:hypothetical protein
MAKRDPFHIDNLLESWAEWKMSSVVGLDFPSTTLEYKLMKGIILGDGCKGGGPDLSRTSPSYQHNEICEMVDGIIIRLSEILRREMLVVRLRYVMRWSHRRTSESIRLSRTGTDSLLIKAKAAIKLQFDLAWNEKTRKFGADPHATR